MDGTLDCSQSISNTVTVLQNKSKLCKTVRVSRMERLTVFKVHDGRNVTHASQDEDGQLVFASIEPAVLNVE